MFTILLSFSTLLLVVASVPVFPLPPCGSYTDCSAGTEGSYNFHPDVPSLILCQKICQEDPNCHHYTFNFSSSSPYHNHCFLSSSCSSPVTGGSWVSGPSVCSQSTEGHQSWFPFKDNKLTFENCKCDLL